MKTCYYCKGGVEDVAIDYMASRRDKYVLVKHLHVEKCRQCGEIYLDYEASRQIDEALDGASSASEHLSVPIVRAG